MKSTVIVLIRKKLKAFSLIEILIAMIVIGFLFTSFLGLASASLKMAKSNEIEDIAMATLIKVKDLIRSSNSLVIDGSNDFSSYLGGGVFVTIDPTGKKLISSTNTEILRDNTSNCDNSKHEWLSTSLGNNGYKVCVQAFMKTVTDHAGICYGIKVVAEKSAGNVFVERLYGYRIGHYSTPMTLSGSSYEFGTADTDPTDNIINFCL